MRQWRGVPVLVTGAEGFIGSVVARQLAAQGAEVHAGVFDDVSRWRLQGIEHQLTLHRLDVRDASQVQRAVGRIAPRRVIHLAAAVDTRRDHALIEPMLRANVEGTRHLLDALVGQRPEAVVLAGTAEEYGARRTLCRTTDPEQPVSPYSWSKTAAAALGRLYHQVWGVPVTVVRFAVTYGPGQVNDLFVPSLIRSCLTRQPLRMTAGRHAREFNYVDDIAGGLIAAAQAPSAAGQIVHLGPGKAHRLLEVVRLVMELTGAATPPLIGALPYRVGEPRTQRLDVGKSSALLGWRSCVALREGLRRTVEWFQDYLAGEADARMAEAAEVRQG